MSETQLRSASGLVIPGAASYRAPDLKIRVLGPLEVLSHGVDVRLGGPKQRTVLALLAAEVGKPVSVDALIDGVWGDEPTTGARSTLQTYVSNLRAAIGDVIVRDDGGYRLVAEPEDVDAVEFERAVEQAAALVESDPARSRATARARRSRSGAATRTPTCPAASRWSSRRGASRSYASAPSKRGSRPSSRSGVTRS